MKKLVFASVMALASISLMTAPVLRAQDITIKDPAEFNAYQMATTQNDPKAKANALEGFLTSFPQSVVKKAVLVMLLETYQGLGDADHVVSTAGRVLQVDPNNMESLFLSVVIKRSQCTRSIDQKSGKTNDSTTCDDGATMAAKGLLVGKPDGVSADDWKKQTDAAYPIFHSMIALDDVVSKGDIKGGISEYRNELMIYAPEGTQSGPGLVDTLNLAEAYAKSAPPDMINAVWFYARAWDFAPAGYKGVIEKKLDYWYNKYHGSLDGLDAIKQSAQATVFPPGTLMITPADTPAQKIHKILANTPDLSTLALEDKELVLAYGAKEDADKLWAILKDQQTPVPGIVIEATASVIKVAVTADAKQAKTADFIVNLKAPLADKEVPAAGAEYKLQPAAELDGTYDSYAQIPATDTVAQSVQIVLRDGFVQAEKKKAAPAAHKPTAAHPAAAHHAAAH
jgi:hypothetical protein